VYDVRGRLVQTLRDGIETAGAKSTAWDGRDRQGQRVASGTYFYRVEFDGAVLTRKMTLLE
jgi:flagellar hook assembly protein FlgD